MADNVFKLTDESVVGILLSLAAEEEKTPEEVLVRLIKDEDEERHSAFVAGKGFLRLNCGREKCAEKKKRKGLEIRD